MPVSRKLSAASTTPRASSRPSAPPPAADEEGPSFEEALERLETIVEELEAGTLTLDQSLTRYEEGMRLSRRLTRTLDQAEKRIERLVEEEGGPGTRLMEDASEAPFEPAGGRDDGGEADPMSDDRTGPGRPGGGEGELPF